MDDIIIFKDHRQDISGINTKISDINTKIGDENSGLIKDINDVKTKINSNFTLKEYNIRDEMINDTTLKEGDVCRTLGFYTPFDDGGAEYIIVTENAKPTPGADGDLSNGLTFKYIIKNRRINII